MTPSLTRRPRPSRLAVRGLAAPRGSRQHQTIWKADSESGDLSEWNWWGGGPADGSDPDDESYGWNASAAGPPARGSRCYSFTASAARPNAKLYQGFKHRAGAVPLDPIPAGGDPGTQVPQDVSAVYSGWFLIPAAIQITDWVNMFQWKEKFADTHSDPVWWVNLVPCAFGDLGGNPFQAECVAAGAADPALYLNNWAGVTGGDRSNGYAIMPVPRGSWFEIRAVLKDNVSIDFTVAGRHFDTALEADCHVGPAEPGTSLEWIFGAGCYVAATQGPIYGDDFSVTPLPA